MSLIKCDECGKEISDKSSVCIHCGNPIYREDPTNVVLLERSWIDLDEEEKISLVCEYEEKTGLNMHFTFWECTVLFNVLIFFCLYVILLLCLFGEAKGLDIFIADALVCLFSYLSYITWQKHRGEISWNRVNASREFNKWLKASKNIVK